MRPDFLRSSGVLNAYITVKKMIVDRSAYSISCVAVNAMSVREKNLKILLSKSLLSLTGISIALPEKRPWYIMMRDKRIG